LIRFDEARAFDKAFCTYFIFEKTTGIVMINLLAIYGFNFFLVEPFDTLAELPHTEFSRILFRIKVNAESMLFPLVPPAFILATISLVVFSIAFFLVVRILAVILNSISVHVVTEALHIVLTPLSVVASTVFPFVNSTTIYFVVVPLAIVGTSIHPGVLSLSLFLTFNVHSFKHGTLWPLL
jgi:hypothetical protein